MTAATAVASAMPVPVTTAATPASRGSKRKRACREHGYAENGERKARAAPTLPSERGETVGLGNQTNREVTRGFGRKKT